MGIVTAGLDVSMTSLGAFLDSYYRLRPVNATFTGIHNHDHRLPDWSPAGLAAATDEMRRLRASLVAERQPDVSLHDMAQREGELAIAFLDIQIAEHESTHFQRGNPSLAAGEAIFSIVSLMTRAFAPTAQRVDAAIARLTAMPAFLEGARWSMVAAVPDEWRTKCLRECDGAARLLGDGIRKWIAVESVDHRRGDQLTRAAEQAARAFGEFRAWLERDVATAPPARLACGAEMFDLLLARGHWCSRSRGDLGIEARAALDRALATLHTRAREAAAGGWPEVNQRLTDVHPDVDRYLPEYQRVWDACYERATAAGLVTWPPYSIRYVPIPIHTRDAAPFLYYLFYRSPAPFDALPVHDYVVTPVERDMPADEQLRRLRATNSSVIKLNHVVHHGAIGHHVQNFYASAGASEIGRVAAVDCASRIGMFAGGTMAEGWACYATDLMDEIGFFTPDESLAQQHTRARLLARAVVDIGLHEGSMTAEDAVALYRDQVGMSPDAARAEVCKNSMFPATAVMYWLGTDGLHKLRRERERIEGSWFSLRRFHDRFLSFGSIPVPLIAKVFE
jgi:Bacterial protein of unknown function (DUF885)